MGRLSILANETDRFIHQSLDFNVCPTKVLVLYRWREWNVRVLHLPSVVFAKDEIDGAINPAEIHLQQGIVGYILIDIHLLN